MCEVAHSLTTSISCRVRLMMSAANVIPTASGRSHVHRQGVVHSVETPTGDISNLLRQWPCPCRVHRRAVYAKSMITSYVVRWEHRHVVPMRMIHRAMTCRLERTLRHIHLARPSVSQLKPSLHRDVKWRNSLTRCFLTRTGKQCPHRE